jgi:hypothetical protein
MSGGGAIQGAVGVNLVMFEDEKTNAIWSGSKWSQAERTILSNVLSNMLFLMVGHVCGLESWWLSYSRSGQGSIW